MSSIGLISENDNSTVLAEYTGLNRVATSFQSEDALEKELIKTLVEQGYERLNINSENELILNLRRQLEKLNNYHFTDGEWDSFFTKVIANKNDYIIETTDIVKWSANIFEYPPATYLKNKNDNSLFYPFISYVMFNN